jgi:hypothetical protein
VDAELYRGGDGAPAAADGVLEAVTAGPAEPGLDEQDLPEPDLSEPDLFEPDLFEPDLLAPGLPVPRWLGALILLVAALTMAWIAELWATLPYRDVSAHYRLAWVGFDAMLAVVLGRTGWLAWRGRDHVELPAVSAATLLVVDMWFDIVTSSAPKDRVLAVASAALVEIPLATLCLWIARNAERVRRQRLGWALLVDPQSLPR